MTNLSKNIDIPSQLIGTIQQAQHIAILTGAGVSAESGVPTFRDAQTGLWARYSPEELATPQAFERDPKLVWEWYQWRRDLVSEAKPNPGHQALAELEKRVPQFTLITQNVDGLHQQSGSQNVVELHGNIHRTVRYEDRRVEVKNWPNTGEVPPRCPDTGSLLRPDVIWFGEMLPAGALETAFEVAATCDVFFSVGTSALVHPAAQLPMIARQGQAIVVEVNPNSTPITSQMHYVLQGPAGEVLPQLVAAL